MIPEIGHFALILALSVSIVQGIFPLIGSLQGEVHWYKHVKFPKIASMAFYTLLLISAGLVINSLLSDNASRIRFPIGLLLIIVFLGIRQFLPSFTLKQKPHWIVIAKPAAFAQLFFLSISFACLLYAFLTNDFSVKYVANNSNSQMPTIFRISALWGAHEGSLLLWGISPWWLGRGCRIFQ